MIFVPSAADISHAETEYKCPEHHAQEANVLLHIRLQLAPNYRYPEETDPKHR